MNIAFIIVESIALPAVVGGYAFYRWRKNGRDPKGRGTIVPQYSQPKDLAPAHIGGLLDFRVDQKDITATILDLAIKRHINIIETKTERKLLPDITTYSFELVSLDTTKLKDHERILLEGLFKNTNLAVGSVVELDSLKNTFYTTVSSAKKKIIEDLVKGEYLKMTQLKVVLRYG
jgi:hypothetical protein